MVDKKTLIKEAKERFRISKSAFESQLAREKEDLEFQIPEKQWRDVDRRAREGRGDGGIIGQPRPCLSIPKLDQPCQLVINQHANAHLGVNVIPVSGDAEEDTANVIKGMYRKIERDSPASFGRNWAFARSAIAGRGWYRVRTEYNQEATDGPEAYDQNIVIERILFQESVYIDPAAEKPDFSDAEYAFVASWMPENVFKRTFPRAEVPSSNDVLDGDSEDAPLWVEDNADSGQRAIRVVEYFVKEHTQRTIRFGDRERVVDDVIVRIYTFTGVNDEILQEGTWNGRYIPLIPTIGRELIPTGKERYWTGVVGPAKDAQRLYNMAASSAVEMAALEPKAPWVGAEGSFDGHEKEWELSNRLNLPYLEFRPVVAEKTGQVMPPPARAQISSERLGPSMMLLQQADSFIQMATATFDPSLGRVDSSNRSGVAISKLQEQSDAATNNYIQNMATISLPYEAKVILDAIPRVYDRPGRIVCTLDEEDGTSLVMLNQHYYVDPLSKRPVPVQVERDRQGNPIYPLRKQGALSLVAGAQPQQQTPPVKFYDLKKGVYAVTVDVGKTRQTLQQEAVDEIGQIIQAQPQMMSLIGPTYFKFREFPGAKELAKMLAVLRDVQYPALKKDENDQEMDLEQAKARIQQLTMQLQEMQQGMQQAQQVIQGKQVEAQSKLQAEQIKSDTNIKTAQIKSATDIAIAQMEERVVKLEALVKSGQQREAAELKAASESALEAQKSENAKDLALLSAVATAGLAPKPPMEMGLEEPEIV